MVDWTHLPFDPTAFMSGQTISKVWLIEEMEDTIRRFPIRYPTIWIYGGWYGTTNYILQARDNIRPKMVVSMDCDEEATKRALILNEAYVWKNVFSAITTDVNTISFDGRYGETPNIIINTSCEHMSDEWFHRIPDGTFVALQSNNMNHDDHESDLSSLDEMIERYPLGELMFSGEKLFDYNEWGFTRFMIMGVK